MLWRGWLNGYIRFYCQRRGSWYTQIENIRRFLFQTWFGSGPDPPGLALPAPAFENESRMPAVVFATSLGRELGCGVPRGVVEVEGTKLYVNNGPPEV